MIIMRINLTNWGMLVLISLPKTWPPEFDWEDVEVDVVVRIVVGSYLNITHEYKI